MYKIVKEIGSNSPKVAIVSCMHGDERFGLKVFKNLENLKLKRGSVTFVVANPLAVKKNVRYIDSDLNRSFPGKQSGNTEERIAYKITPFLKQFDLIIDLHSTNSNFSSAAIITKRSKQIMNFISKVPINKIIHIASDVRNQSLINQFKLAISLEYGPKKNDLPAKRATEHVKIILANLGMLNRKKRLYLKKEIYSVYDLMRVDKKFVQDKNIDDFKEIKKGQILGRLGKETIYSNKNFYPLFVGRGKYPGYFGMMAKKIKKFL